MQEPVRVEYLEEDEMMPGHPLSLRGDPAELDPDDAEWAEMTGLMAERKPQGATFVPIGNGVEIIAVRGAQPLHHDRHLLTEGFPPDMSHTWNVVVSGDGSQSLLAAADRGIFDQHPMEAGAVVYFSTAHPHALSRTTPDDLCVIVQVQGYGPDRQREAMEHLKAVLSRRTVTRREERQAA